MAPIFSMHCKNFLLVGGLVFFISLSVVQFIVINHDFPLKIDIHGRKSYFTGLRDAAVDIFMNPNDVNEKFEDKSNNIQISPMINLPTRQMTTTLNNDYFDIQTSYDEHRFRAQVDAAIEQVIKLPLST